MVPRTLLHLLILPIGIAVTTSAGAAEWHQGIATGGSSRPPDVMSYLRQNSDRLGIRGIDLTATTKHQGAGLSTIRYSQSYAGLPVFGSSAAVRLDAAGQVRAVMLDVAKNLLVSTQPAIDRQAAIARVAAYGLHAPGPTTRSELGVMPHRDRGGILVWRVHVPTKSGMYRYVIDAQNGALLSVVNLARYIKGNVYPIGPVPTPSPGTVDLLNLKLVTPQRLDGRAASVYRYVSGNASEDPPQTVSVEQTAVLNDNGNFDYYPSTTQPEVTDAFAEVNAYYHLNRIDSWYRDTLNVPMGFGLMVAVNYTEDSSTFDNAFFTPWEGEFANAIFLGQGDWSDYSYDSDVIFHEFAHYVNWAQVGFDNGAFDFDELGVLAMPSAIDEGTADYFSSTINNDPIVGESCLGDPRDLSMPPGGACPDGIVGESHEDGKMVGWTAWAIREAIGPALADPIVWGGVSLLPVGASFADLASGILQTAKDFFAQGKITAEQLKTIESILQREHLDTCKRIIALAPDTPVQTYMMGLTTFGMMVGYSCSELREALALTSLFQFEYTPKPNDDRARFNVALKPYSGGSKLDWSVYVRRDDGVTYVGGMNYPLEATGYDYALEDLSARTVDLTIDKSSTPPFDPTATYTLSIRHVNCPTVLATIEATSAPAIVPDAGPDARPDARPDVGTDVRQEGSAAPLIDSAIPTHDAPTDRTMAEMPVLDGSKRDGATQLAEASAQDMAEMAGGGCSCAAGVAIRQSGLKGLGLLAATLLLRRRRTRGHKT